MFKNTENVFGLDSLDSSNEIKYKKLIINTLYYPYYIKKDINIIHHYPSLSTKNLFRCHFSNSMDSDG
ncbi:hypothetical protein D3C87_719870 [compost metagenome]